MLKTCPRCNKTFDCKHSEKDNCQCSKIKLTDKDFKFIAKHYYDCLCLQCLQEISERLKTTE